MVQTKPEFARISPEFAVEDVTAAVAFYREQLGFDLGWKFGVTHANVCRGAVAITLLRKPDKAGNGEAYVELRGVDAYHAELTARHVEVGALDDRFYGMRDFALLDLDGNRLVFGEVIVE